MENKEYFEGYCDSIFARSNNFSPEEYFSRVVLYKLNYAEYLPEDRNANILDIGCGTGHFLGFLKEKGYVNFLGIDVSQQQIEYCKEKVSEKVLRADSFEFLADKKGQFDLIAANDILEHIPKDKIIEFLRLAFDALKEKGKLLIKTPNMGNLFALRLRYVDFTHQIGLTEKSLFQVLWLAGFRKIDILPLKESGWKRKILAKPIRLVISKLMWYQGFVAPKILTESLIAKAQK